MRVVCTKEVHRELFFAKRQIFTGQVNAR